MKGHSEPVGRFLPPHLLDSLDDGAEVVAAAHRREGTEDECQRESVVFGKRPGFVLAREQAGGEDTVSGQARLFEAAHDTTLDKFEIATAQTRR